MKDFKFAGLNVRIFAGFLYLKVLMFEGFDV